MALKDINKPENVQVMKDVSDDIERTILKYKNRVEAALVAGACIQIATRLFVLYPPKLRDGLIDGAIMLLRGEAPDDNDDEPANIIIPKGLSRRKH